MRGPVEVVAGHGGGWLEAVTFAETAPGGWPTCPEPVGPLLLPDRCFVKRQSTGTLWESTRVLRNGMVLAITADTTTQ